MSNHSPKSLPRRSDNSRVWAVTDLYSPRQGQSNGGFVRSPLRRWGWSSLRKYISLFAISLILSWCGLACTPSANNTEANRRPSAAQNLVLRIGHQKFDPLTLVKNKGHLEERLKPLGVSSVEWKEFQSGPPLMEALNVNSIDIARTGDTPPVIAQAAGVPLVYIGGSAPKDRSAALMVKQDSPIRTIADLKGKTIAFAKSSSSNYLIVEILKSGGLKWEDIRPAYLSPADARTAFEKGSVDAWVVWDPFYAAAVAKANARVLRDSQGLVSNRDFYLADRSFAQTHREIIDALREETQSVAAWAKQNPKEVAQFLSPLLKIETPILETVTERRNYGFEPITPEMIAEQQAIADTFYQIGLIPKTIQIKEAILQSST